MRLIYLKHKVVICYGSDKTSSRAATISICHYGKSGYALILDCSVFIKVSTYKSEVALFDAFCSSLKTLSNRYNFEFTASGWLLIRKLYKIKLYKIKLYKIKLYKIKLYKIKNG